MNENENQTPNFSDIPALGDTQGLENYLNNQQLAAQGLTPAQPAQPAAPAATQPATQPAAQPTAPETPQFTKEQLAAIVQNIDNINNQLGQRQAQRQPVPGASGSGYSAQEQQFIQAALQRGYSLDRINAVIMQKRAQAGGYGNNSQLEQRIAQMEQFLKTEQYRQAQNAFIDKATNFANKFGLSDADVEVFANEALKHGINIAMNNVDLEMVFRAVFPEQYAIRSQRMTPTSASQIYGGTSIQESTRASASKAEDAYVEAFLKNAMPNQYGK